MMKSKFLVLLIGVFLSACVSNTTIKSGSGENIIRYAKHLQIKEYSNFTEIRILSPETGKPEQTWRFSKEKSGNGKSIQVPLKHLAVLSSTHVGMLTKLKAIKKIVAVTNRHYVYNPDLLNRIEKGKVIELGEEGQIPVELLLKSKCNALIYSGFGKEFPHQKQLTQVGVNCIVNYDWRETHPLGKAEWILLFGYLIGKEKEALAYFLQLEKEYTELKTEASKTIKQPIVLSGNLWGETWFAPSGESFNAVLFKDAHVRYRYADSKGTGSLALTMEKILSDNVETDFWINPGMPTKAKLFGLQPKLKLLGPAKKNPIYDYSQSGNLYWEMSAIEPQKVLSDYLQIFHSTAVSKKNLYFYSEVK